MLNDLDKKVFDKKFIDFLVEKKIHPSHLLKLSQQINSGAILSEDIFSGIGGALKGLYHGFRAGYGTADIDQAEKALRDQLDFAYRTFANSVEKYTGDKLQAQTVLQNLRNNTDNFVTYSIQKKSLKPAEVEKKSETIPSSTRRSTSTKSTGDSTTVARKETELPKEVKPEQKPKKEKPEIKGYGAPDTRTGAGFPERISPYAYALEKPKAEDGTEKEAEEEAKRKEDIRKAEEKRREAEEKAAAEEEERRRALAAGEPIAGEMFRKGPAPEPEEEKVMGGTVGKNFISSFDNIAVQILDKVSNKEFPFSVLDTIKRLYKFKALPRKMSSYEEHPENIKHLGKKNWKKIMSDVVGILKTNGCNFGNEEYDKTIIDTFNEIYEIGGYYAGLVRDLAKNPQWKKLIAALRQVSRYFDTFCEQNPKKCAPEGKKGGEKLLKKLKENKNFNFSEWLFNKETH